MSEDPVCFARSSPIEALMWITISFFGGFAGVSAFGPIVSQLKQSMAISPLLMGLLAASPAMTGSLLRIPFGAAVDRMGGKRPIMILLGLAAAGIAGMTCLFGFDATSSRFYLLFLAFGMLCGCGIAVFSVGVPAVSYWHPQNKQGTALAIYGGLGNLAPGLFALIIPFLVVKLGFAAAYVVWLSALILLLIMAGRFMKDAPYFQYREMGIDIDPEALLLACGEELIPSGTAMASLKKAGSDWRTWVLTYFYFVTFGGFIALTIWFPTYWSERFGMGIVQAGLLTALYSLSASLLRVLGGFAADRYGGENVTLASFLTVAAGAGIMSAGAQNMAFAVSGMLLLALGMGFSNAAVFKLVPKFSPKSVGGASGIIGGLGAFGGFVLPLVLGLFVKISGNAGYSHGFMVFAGLSAISLPLLLMIKRCTTKSIG